MIRSVGTWIAFVLSLIAVLAVAVAVQAFAELWSVRFDLTSSGYLSLSESTKKVLADVQKPLEVTYYYESGKRQKGADLFELFGENCPQLRYELLDLDRNPMRARDDGVRNYGRAVLRYDGRTLVAPTSTEHGLATAIRRLLRKRERVVYFLTGHGERTLAVGLRDQFGEASRVLREAGYDLRTLTLLQIGDVPEDAAALVLAGPELDYVESELAALDRYLQRGGGILLLVDPVVLPGLEGWVTRHGLALDDDVVIDGSNRAFGTDGTNVIVPYWRNHPSTEGLDKPGVLGRARSVGLVAGRAEGDPSGQAAIVARSDAKSFRARDASRTKAGRVDFDASRDEAGPVGVMGVTLVTGGGEEGRIAVIGDADFASDNFLRLHGNQALLLRALGWVARGETQEEAPGLEAADTAPLSALYISEDQAQRIFAIAVLVEPLLLLAVGICVAVARRRRR